MVDERLGLSPKTPHHHSQLRRKLPQERRQLILIHRYRLREISFKNSAMLNKPMRPGFALTLLFSIFREDFWCSACTAANASSVLGIFGIISGKLSFISTLLSMLANSKQVSMIACTLQAKVG